MQDNPIDDFVLERIKYFVDRLIREIGYRPSEKEDLKQELIVGVLEAMPKFDPQRSKRETFVRRVLENRYVDLIRRRSTKQRSFENSVHSLSDPITPGEKPAHQTVIDPQPASNDLSIDIADVIKTLPPRAQQVAAMLGSHTKTFIAEQLGVSESTVRRDAELIGRALRDAGFDRSPLGARRISAPPAKEVSSDQSHFPGVTMPTGIDFLINEPAEVYHAKAKDNLSSHALANFRKCPLLYRRKQLGLIEDIDRPAYVLGRAAHTLILEGRDRFEAEYMIGGPVNPKTGQPYGANTKAFSQWAAEHGKSVLTHPQVALIEQMASAVADHDGAQALLRDGVPEAVIRTKHLNMDCQSRIDWFAFTRGVQGIVDLKTCDDLTWFESDARRFGYVHQLAFYRSMVWQMLDEYVPVHIIAVEKKEPFRCGMWRVGQDVLAIAQQDNEQAIDKLKRCKELDQWPTGYEDVRVFDHL